MTRCRQSRASFFTAGRLANRPGAGPTGHLRRRMTSRRQALPPDLPHAGRPVVKRAAPEPRTSPPCEDGVARRSPWNVPEGGLGMSRVVIIGATGHIGSYLVPRLV